MITVKNAKAYFETTLDFENDKVATIWEKFKVFCREDIQGEEEKEILFECGIFKFTGEKMLHFNFVRQFTKYEDDEYGGMEQLHCEFLFEYTKEVKRLKATEWSMDYESLDEFFAAVEDLKAFQKVLQLTPIKRELYQEEV